MYSENTQVGISQLPILPAPTVSDRYSFIDTKQVTEDMKELGFVPVRFRRPSFRTKAGAYGIHEVEFRRPEHLDDRLDLAPRVIFLNSYDGSRRAQFAAGIFRFVCSNGLMLGTTFEEAKFLHLDTAEADMQESLKAVQDNISTAFDRLEAYRSIELTRAEQIRLAERALEIRLDAGALLTLSPEVALMPRRREDVKRDLWTTWNVLQENLTKGGLPARTSSGSIRTTRSLSEIQRSNRVNRGLWDLLEQTALEEA